MKYRIHPAAEQEAEQAAEWYGERAPALAIEFARQHQLAIDWIIQSPRRYPLAEDAPEGVECRNMTHLGRFPYRIVYAIFGDEIYFVAAAHHHQRPGYWHTRLTDSPPEVP
jgi:plasmid stabilization system protein ParE